MNIMTVSQINSYLRQVLEADEIICDIWVEGEISNFKHASTGHCYFSLKEGNAVLRAAMWRNHAVRLSTSPNNGDAVLAHGHVSLYEVSGDIQLYVDMLHPAGVGLLHAQFEELKTRLESEGLFDERRKRPLPVLPRRIGIVTSAQGAALQDILTILGRRCPLIEVYISPCMVQGEQAPQTIVAALHTLYHHDVDVIIVARGGGSLEDLWAFNEEIVVRAVFASPVPIITGVGHETDTTIVDYVADVRAPTPSASAELAVPEYAALTQAVAFLQQRLEAAMRYKLDICSTQLDDLAITIEQHTPFSRITRARQQVADMLRRCETQLSHQLSLYQVRLQGTTARLETLNPYATLARGYAIMTHAGSRTVVTHAHQVEPGDVLMITLCDGQVTVKVAEGA